MIRCRNGVIGRFNIADIIEETEIILGYLARILRADGEEGKRWGYLTIRRREDGRVLLVTQIGECPEEKAEKYMRLSLEKGERLHYFQTHNDISSWQSRNTSESRYGGAICAGPLILSFSGLPEYADEAAMIKLARFLGLIRPMTCHRLALISGNHYVDKLMKLHRSVYH